MESRATVSPFSPANSDTAHATTLATSRTGESTAARVTPRPGGGAGGGVPHPDGPGGPYPGGPGGPYPGGPGGPYPGPSGPCSGGGPYPGGGPQLSVTGTASPAGAAAVPGSAPARSPGP
ncbi:hypothetical protein GCM10027047_14710 [Rhodococcus aerolatus]